MNVACWYWQLGWMMAPFSLAERGWRAAWRAWYRFQRVPWDRTQAFAYHLDFRPRIIRHLPTGTLENGAWLDHLDTVGWRFVPQ